MPNSSERNAACGPYMAPCSTSPTTTASAASAKFFVSSSAMNTNAHTPTPTAPIRYTGRRPMRSDSAPHIGIAAMCTAAPISTAPSANELDSLSCAVT